MDATRDREIIETELILADLQTLMKQVEPKMNATKEDRMQERVTLLLNLMGRQVLVGYTNLVVHVIEGS